MAFGLQRSFFSEVVFRSQGAQPPVRRECHSGHHNHGIGCTRALQHSSIKKTRNPSFSSPPPQNLTHSSLSGCWHFKAEQRKRHRERALQRARPLCLRRSQVLLMCAGQQEHPRESQTKSWTTLVIMCEIFFINFCLLRSYCLFVSHCESLLRFILYLRYRARCGWMTASSAASDWQQIGKGRNMLLKFTITEAPSLRVTLAARSHVEN